MNKNNLDKLSINWGRNIKSDSEIKLMQLAVQANEDTLKDDKWKVFKSNLFIKRKKYFITCFFVVGLISVSIIKNETRILQKEIDKINSSIYNIRVNLHEATLDHEILTSPEYISELARKYLDTNFHSYEKFQLKEMMIEENIKIAKIFDFEKINVENSIDNSNKNKDQNYDNIFLRPENSFKVKNKPNGNKKFNQWAIVQVLKAMVGLPPLPIE